MTHYRSWTAYIDFAAYIGSGTNSSAGGENNLKARNAGISNGMSWVRELEDRQRVALRSAKREKNILESRNSDSEVDSFFDNGSDNNSGSDSDGDNTDVDRVRRVDSSSSSSSSSSGGSSSSSGSSRSRSVRESDRDRELDRESYGDRDRDRDRRGEMSGDRDQDDISIMSNSALSSSSSSKSFEKATPSSELDFVLQYETEIGNNDRDECDGQDESEGGAIDRALKLLGLDGRRTSSQGSTR